LDKLYPIIGQEKMNIKNVMILGGSSIGQKTSRNLCKENYKVKLIEKRETEQLPLQKI
jgi:trk system potassium uptake protein TrkA